MHMNRWVRSPPHIGALIEGHAHKSHTTRERLDISTILQSVSVYTNSVQLLKSRKKTKIQNYEQLKGARGMKMVKELSEKSRSCEETDKLE